MRFSAGWTCLQARALQLQPCLFVCDCRRRRRMLLLKYCYHIFRYRQPQRKRTDVRCDMRRHSTGMAPCRGQSTLADQAYPGLHPSLPHTTMKSYHQIFGAVSTLKLRFHCSSRLLFLLTDINYFISLLTLPSTLNDDRHNPNANQFVN